MTANNRWEWLEGVKRQEAEEVAVRELGKMVCEELQHWPPRVEDEAERYKSLWLKPVVWTEACVEQALLQLEMHLTRAFDALDDYGRNQRLARACPNADEQLLSTFLSEFLLESSLELIERTENRVRRKQLVRGIPELRIRLCKALLTSPLN